jgi:hypothetical protein
MLLASILAACEPEPPVKLDPPIGLCDACDEACVEEGLLADTREHVEGGVDYEDLPPTSGDHDPCWAPWGVYDAEVPDERWVHNLEHGGIVLLYRCPDGCPDEVAEMEQIIAERGVHGTLTPYAGLPTRFAAVAWGYRYTTDCFDVDALNAFWDAHVDRAPESLTSDPSASCPPL